HWVGCAGGDGEDNPSACCDESVSRLSFYTAKIWRIPTDDRARVEAVQAFPRIRIFKEASMRFHKLAIVAVLALASVPAAAFAAQPSHPATPANSHANSNANATSTTGASSKANSHASAAKVMFVLRGTLTAYTAAVGSTNGSVSITVKSSNHESSLLKGSTLTFPVSSTTKIAGTFKALDN